MLRLQEKRAPQGVVTTEDETIVRATGVRKTYDAGAVRVEAPAFERRDLRLY